jgi:hypothetical protein
MMPYPLLWNHRVGNYRKFMGALEGEPEAGRLALREAAFELPCRAMLDGFCQQAQLRSIRLSLAVVDIDLDAGERGAGRDLVVRLRHRAGVTIAGTTDPRWLGDVRTLLERHLPLPLLGSGSYTLDRDHPVVRRVLAEQTAGTLGATSYELAIRRLAQEANGGFGLLHTHIGASAPV